MNEKKLVTIALQGGGSYGAFSWGVLDAFFSDNRLQIEGMSGSSAGALNILSCAQGLIKNGNEGAKQSLHDCWKKISDLIVKYIPDMEGSFSKEEGFNNSDFNMFFSAFQAFLSSTSPYLNIYDVNPLSDMFSDFFEFEKIQKSKIFKIFISATNVKNGQIKIFKNSEITLKTLLASTCLPSRFKAVEIDNNYYWDGGFVANPAIYPLIYECKAIDIILIKIHKVGCDHAPKTLSDIQNALNDLSFNGSLQREMRAINFITTLLNENKIDSSNANKINFHIIEIPSLEFKKPTNFGAYNTNWDFLLTLHSSGFELGKAWISDNIDKIGTYQICTHKKLQEFL